MSKTHFLLSAIVIATGAVYGKNNNLGGYLDSLTAPHTRTATFDSGATYTLCFVPDGPSCEQLLIERIHQTRNQLLIQAYSFTSPKIADAVKQANARGVDVRVVVDKSQVREQYTSATFLKNSGIPVWIDDRPAIAHNKVMIFDRTAVFTGSFNFSRSAQERNAENGIVIAGDRDLVNEYVKNWEVRRKVSVPY